MFRAQGLCNLKIKSYTLDKLHPCFLNLVFNLRDFFLIIFSIVISAPQFFIFSSNRNSPCVQVANLLFYEQITHHIETSPLICSANQRTGFYVIGTSVIRKVKVKVYISILRKIHSVPASMFNSFQALFSQKSSIIYVWQNSKYVFVLKQTFLTKKTETLTILSSEI